MNGSHVGQWWEATRPLNGHIIFFYAQTTSKWVEHKIDGVVAQRHTLHY